MNVKYAPVLVAALAHLIGGQVLMLCAAPNYNGNPNDGLSKVVLYVTLLVTILLDLTCKYNPAGMTCSLFHSPDSAISWGKRSTIRRSWTPLPPTSTPIDVSVPISYMFSLN
jgi:hypothetical protein